MSHQQPNLIQIDSPGKNEHYILQTLVAWFPTWGKKKVDEKKGSILLNQQLQNPLKINPKETDTEKSGEKK